MFIPAPPRHTYVNDLSPGFILSVSTAPQEHTLLTCHCDFKIMDSVGNAKGGYTQLDDSGQGPRRRYGEGVAHDEGDEGVYDELNRLRGIVDVIEGGRNKGGLKLSLNNSAMSTIFGFVFVVIITVTIYAFANLYRALSKRFFPVE